MHVKVYVLYSLLFVVTIGGLHYSLSQPRIVNTNESYISHRERATVASTMGHSEQTAASINDKKEIEKSEFYPMDVFGNYVLSEEDLESLDKTILNENGKVLYNVYTDGDGVILNPMPDYYAGYDEYFEIGHAVSE